MAELVDGCEVSGEILLEGTDIFHPEVDVTELRKAVGLLAQKPSPLPMSIYENVSYGPRIHGENDDDKLDAIVENYLKVVGLWNEVKDRLDEPGASLSIGQQQRLCLARGLAVEPKVILCDEPTSALDPNGGQIIESLLISLKEEYTIVLVTHTLRQAKRLADRVIYLYMGEVVEEGAAEDVFNNPKNKKTREYMTGKIG